MLKVPKISLQIFAISPEKHRGWSLYLQINIKVDSITLVVRSQACPNYPKQQVPKVAIFQCLYNISKTKLTFSIQISIKVSYKVILSWWMGMTKQSQSTRCNKFTISWKRSYEWSNFYANKHQSFYKLALSFLMEVARHVQSTQHRNLVIFLQYI